MRSISAVLAKIPSAWALGVLLALSVWSHRITGKEFTRVCENATFFLETLPATSVAANASARRLQRVYEDRIAEPDPTFD